MRFLGFFGAGIILGAKSLVIKYRRYLTITTTKKHNKNKVPQRQNPIIKLLSKSYIIL